MRVYYQGPWVLSYLSRRAHSLRNKNSKINSTKIPRPAVCSKFGPASTSTKRWRSLTTLLKVRSIVRVPHIYQQYIHVYVLQPYHAATHPAVIRAKHIGELDQIFRSAAAVHALTLRRTKHRAMPLPPAPPPFPCVPFEPLTARRLHQLRAARAPCRPFGSSPRASPPGPALDISKKKRRVSTNVATQRAVTVGGALRYRPSL